MKRRDFLQAGTIGCALAVSNPTAVLGVESSSGLSPSHEPSAFELDEVSLSQLQESMKSGKHTSRSLVKKYLERIDDIDKNGPRINSVIEINPDAVAIAESLDRERKERGVRGPLHGIPLLIKDNIDTADRMMTTAGSLALLGSTPTNDSFVAHKLRDAGAVIIGKTNLSEWANFRSNHSTSGWSGRGGQTKNPYNSLVGIKPTVGLISRVGIIPIAHSQDTAGPMARTVTDAAILLGALTSVDSRDPITKLSRGKAYTDYTQFLARNGLQGARIGVARKYFGFNDRVDKLMDGLIGEIKKLGAIVIDPADIPTSGKFDDSELQVLLYEFKSDLNAYLKALGPKVRVHSLKEIIEFNQKNREKEMPYFGQDLFEKAQAKGPLTSKEYVSALAKNHLLSRTQGIDFVIRKHQLDALIAPTGGPSWPTDWVNGDHFTGGYSSASAVAGYPHVTVPAGYVFGLPCGISFFGSAYSEPKLIKFAYAFEQASNVRRPPRFLTSVELKD